LTSTDKTAFVSGPVKFPVDANKAEEPNNPTTAAAQTGATKGLRDLNMKPST
jgi:hypothetical protein